MKNLLTLLLSVPVFLACNGSDESSESEVEKKPGDNFTVSGTISGADNETLYLEAMSPQGTINVSQTTIKSGGGFSMSGNIPGFGIYQLKLGMTNKIIPLTLVPNDDVKIEASSENFNVTPKVSGTDWAKVMTDYMVIFSEFHGKQEELIANRGTQSEAELSKKFMELKKPVDDFSIKAMRKDPKNAFNVVLSASATPTLGFSDWDSTNLEVLKMVSEAYEKEYPGSPMTNSMSNQTYQIELAYQKHILNSSGTRVAPEIALNNPEGRQIKLSSLRGKYVLIDFWASWCAPCRAENPNVVRLYNKYKDKGFTIYSVSLDNDKAKWKEAIEKDGLVWPNHVSDLLQWNSSLPQLYEFTGIPHTVLLNKEGKIIGVGLRGASLEQKLEEIFSN